LSPSPSHSIQNQPSARRPAVLDDHRPLGPGADLGVGVDRRGHHVVDVDVEEGAVGAALLGLAGVLPAGGAAIIGAVVVVLELLIDRLGAALVGAGRGEAGEAGDDEEAERAASIEGAPRGRA
jgi:hypothetical protein